MMLKDVWIARILKDCAVRNSNTANYFSRLIMMKKAKLELTTIREIWTNVEATNTSTLLQLNDAELVRQLHQQVERKLALSLEESQSLNAYISSKTPLIRDLAESRMAMV